jgi:hypothetical protein
LLLTLHFLGKRFRGKYLTAGGFFFVEDGGFPNVLDNYIEAKAKHVGAHRRARR